jgi:hypothetical protein
MVHQPGSKQVHCFTVPRTQPLGCALQKHSFEQHWFEQHWIETIQTRQTQNSQTESNVQSSNLDKRLQNSCGTVERLPHAAFNQT